ncbi:MAG: 3-deoxy-D-manno-octulosonic acid transferase [Cyclobacteriaceae bacterium]|nr:3-deoxy-D-manno-octulosonic acid transferase [Cyclobacteriaceae bacterium]
MPIFYHLIIRTYNLLLTVSSLFNRKARLIIQGRKKTFRIIRKMRKPGERIIWFHCASLGEFEQGRPLMESLKKNQQDYKIYVSFFSASGYEIKNSDPLLDCAFYLPADTGTNARRLLSLMNPEMAVFIKYEFWYHFFRACNRRNIPIVSISTILRPDQVFFRSYAKFYRDVLKRVDAYFVQNEETRDLLKNIGIDQVMITGDTRFDRVFKIRSGHKPLPLIEQFMNGKRLVILGSTWKSDIDLWRKFINDNREKYKFLIAPHHIDEANLRYIEDQVSLKSIRFSKVNENPDAGIEMIIMDRIGLLSSLYYYGYVNYVGGSFNEGLHNLLEPAVYGAPVLMGRADTNEKYQEAVDLVAAGGAYEINDLEELERIMHSFSGDDHFYWDTGDRAKKYVESNLGATGKIVSSLEKMLNKRHGRAGI